LACKPLLMAFAIGQVGHRGKPTSGNGIKRRSSLTRSPAYTSAMFSETRYARNGDLSVAYRASREGPRDIVFVPNWATCCEHLPELPFEHLHN
jgi:hypothetical protein